MHRRYCIIAVNFDMEPHLESAVMLVYLLGMESSVIKSPETWMFVQRIVQEFTIENIKFPHYCPFIGGIHQRLVNSTQKGQLGGYSIHSTACYAAVTVRDLMWRPFHLMIRFGDMIVCNTLCHWCIGCGHILDLGFIPLMIFPSKFKFDWDFILLPPMSIIGMCIC